MATDAPRHATYKQWSAQVQETNKCAKDFLAGGVKLETMAKFFDHESQIFQSWVESGAFDKDWTEDFNR